MLKLIALFTAGSLTLALSVQAAKPADKAEAATHPPKPKNVQKQQSAPKQPQQLRAPKPQVQKMQTQQQNRPMPNSAGPKVSKKEIQQTPPAVQSRTQPQVQSNKIQKLKDQVRSNKQPQQQKVQQPSQSQSQPLQTNNNQQLKQNKKLSQQSIQKIRAQHRNFHAQPNTSIASAQFNQNYRIQAAQNWNGAQYNAFRSYQPQWHDQGWWKSHHRRLSLISGGWYFWDGGYWYPAWGYDEGAAYYPYDGPIYSGPSARPFDQVVADVQAALQEQGYYRGEVDGLLGPQSRQALAEYQSAQGLYATETIDQPTLSSLGLAG